MIVDQVKGENKMTREEMIRNYATLAAAHKYIVGFESAGKLYYTVYADMIADELLKLDRASSKKGGMAKIRVRLSSKIKAILLHTGKAIEIGNAEELTAGKYNRGENFERVITEKLTGETWVKDNVPFNVAGDIRLNGEEIQIKFDGAELTNEKVLARAMA